MTQNSSHSQESHLRSILKGITWRLLASADTFIVALLVTWVLQGEASYKVGFQIVFFEFFIKLVVYYIHERSWQFAWKDGVVTRRESIIKSITWRAVATLTTFIIAFFALKEEGGIGHNKIAGAIALVELVTKFLLYFLHERIWLKIPLGTVRKVLKK